MTYATTPGDCIDRVASDGGDRVLFRTTWNSKATAQGNIEHELAMPSAAFHFWHRLTEFFCDKGRKARTHLKFKTVRNTSLRWTNHQATWSSLLLQWMRFTLVMSTSLRVHFQVGTRIIKLLNELKLVQRKFEFAKIWWMKALNSVKSPLKPPKTWPTLSSSN